MRNRKGRPSETRHKREVKRNTLKGYTGIEKRKYSEPFERVMYSLTKRGKQQTEIVN